MKRGIWKKLLKATSIISVFCTTYALILPAVTQATPVYCQMEEHIHGVDCLDGPDAEETAKDADASLQAEEESAVVIGEEVSHDGMDEQMAAEETVEAQAGSESDPASSKDISPASPARKCSEIEHVHTRQCHANPDAGTETRKHWENQLPAVMTGDLKEDILSVAMSQNKYKESYENFFVDSMNKEHGWNRYGAYFGSPYSPWKSMFVDFVLEYAGASPIHLPESQEDLAKWLDSGILWQNYIDADSELHNGDLVFFKDMVSDTYEIRYGFVMDADTYTVLLPDYGRQVSLKKSYFTANDILGLIRFDDPGLAVEDAGFANEDEMTGLDSVRSIFGYKYSGIEKSEDEDQPEAVEAEDEEVAEAEQEADKEPVSAEISSEEEAVKAEEQEIADTEEVMEPSKEAEKVIDKIKALPSAEEAEVRYQIYFSQRDVSESATEAGTLNDLKLGLNAIAGGVKNETLTALNKDVAGDYVWFYNLISNAREITDSYYSLNLNDRPSVQNFSKLESLNDWIDANLLESDISTLVHEGGDYSIEVTYGPEALLPKGVELAVRELTSKEHEKALEKTHEAMDVEELSYARYFDISFVYEGVEYEPAEGVIVKITTDDMIPAHEDDIKAVHFPENAEEPEILKVYQEESAIFYTQESFSITGVVVVPTTEIESGKKYALYYSPSNSNKHYVLRNNNGNLTLAESSIKASELEETDVWIFEAVEDRWTISNSGTKKTYYIKLGKKTVYGFTFYTYELVSDPTISDIVIVDNGVRIFNKNGKTDSKDGKDWIGLSVETRYQEGLSLKADNCYNTVPTGFSFVRIDPEPVTKSPGDSNITVNLFDYYLKDQWEDTRYSAANIDAGINADTSFNFGHDYKEPAYNVWTGKSANPYQGIVNPVLSNGFPYLSSQVKVSDTDKKSLAYLFDPETNSDYREEYTDLQGLLYEEQDGNYKGYTGYDSTKYFAYYDWKQEGNKTIELFNSPAVSSEKGGDVPTDYGQFFPILADDSKKGTTLDQIFQSVGEGVYQKVDRVNSKQITNHYFGMSMQVKFYQTPDGKVTYYDGEKSTTREMHFTFTGDDDVWIFIDGVLVGDIGGIHLKTKIDINFANGDIEINGKKVSNLNAQYANAKKYLEEQVRVDDKTVQRYTTSEDLQAIYNKISTMKWSGNTYAFGNGEHTLDFFYLERGNDRSNLSLHFNLQQYPGLRVQKRVTGSSPQLLGDPYYEFAVSFTEAGDEGQPHSLSDYAYQVYDSETKELVKEYSFAENTATVQKKNEGQCEPLPYYNKEEEKLHFFLKANEYAVFAQVSANTKYAVQEILNDQIYSETTGHIYNPAKPWTHKSSSSLDKDLTASSILRPGSSAIDYYNHVNKDMVGDLQIYKNLLGGFAEGDSPDTKYFEAEIVLKDRMDKILDLEGMTYRVVDDKQKSQDEPALFCISQKDEAHKIRVEDTSNGKKYFIHLHPYKTTILEGLLPGTHYTIKEVNDPDYSCDVREITGTIGSSTQTGAGDASVSDENVTVTNMYGVALPETGGKGTWVWMLSGGLLMLIPVFWVIHRRMSGNFD